MITPTAKGRYYITAGTPFPYLCPKCNCIVPCTDANFDKPLQKCLMCDYEGPLEEFDVEWEFIPAQ